MTGGVFIGKHDTFWCVAFKKTKNKLTLGKVTGVLYKKNHGNGK